MFSIFDAVISVKCDTTLQEIPVSIPTAFTNFLFPILEKMRVCNIDK